MITLIDRQLMGNFFRAYGICLTSMLALYIVVDLFTNLDDFTGKGRGIKQVIFDIGTFYSYRVLQIFDHLCEAILLLAAMFTVTWMQRCNEQVPLLAAGVSTGRIVAPVLFSSFALLSLSIINQEIFVPAVADKLVCQKDDPHGLGPMVVRGRYEPNGIHIEGEKASRTNHEVTNLRVTIPESLAGNLIHITARQAIFTQTQRVVRAENGNSCTRPRPRSKALIGKANFLNPLMSVTISFRFERSTLPP